jgi:hypothetical protein
MPVVEPATPFAFIRESLSGFVKNPVILSGGRFTRKRLHRVIRNQFL